MRHSSVLFAALLACLPAVVSARAEGRRLPEADPAALGLSAERLARIDAAVADALRQGDCPGAVVLVARDGKAAYRKAYGQRVLDPAPVPMTADTVFDLASLTKPVATASSVFVLVGEGRLRLSDPVARHWPEFAANGKDKVTVEHLLLHTSGLIPDNPLADYQKGREAALAALAGQKLASPPGERFAYSDVGFLVLGHLVERLSGEPLDAFARRRVFEPAGMADTAFRPGDALKSRAAPTEKIDGRWRTGEVHDPRAFALGGVAGHAGLFGTADDLAVFGQMLLEGGRAGERQVLPALAVHEMIRPRPVPGGLRSAGWDVLTGYSAPRGELFPPGENFGHTGFTGTSLWVDPGTRMVVVLLTSRLHGPRGTNANTTPLRSRVGTLAAAAVLSPAVPAVSVPAAERAAVRTGLDVLVREKFARLKGRRVGLVANHTAVDQGGRSAVELLAAAEGVTLAALFSPEHGLAGAVDEKVADAKDPRTGLPVWSLYGERRKPTAEILRGLDTLVFDIQDAGCRFYTYSSTLGLVLEAASEQGLRVVVLDRPNPIGGRDVEGPVRDAGRESFTAYHAVPVRHGLTVGELARLYVAERKLKCPLEVVAVEGWRRGDLFDRTGLAWVNPSPNLRNPTAALLYPGIGLLETTNVSVGRGTDRPFEWLGAPWIDGRALAAALNAEGIPGLRFVPAMVTPASSTHAGKACGGVQVLVDDRSRVRPVAAGVAVAAVLRRLYPAEWTADRFDRLLCHKATAEGVRRGEPWYELAAAWAGEERAFAQRRRPYLLYEEE